MDRLEVIDQRFLGKGYRDVPPAVVSAVGLASEGGLELEPVFSGKALASLLDAAEQEGSGELLFWNTHDRHSDRVTAQTVLSGQEATSLPGGSSPVFSILPGASHQ
jgi:hypothetical protein